MKITNTTRIVPKNDKIFVHLSQTHKNLQTEEGKSSLMVFVIGIFLQFSFSYFSVSFSLSIKTKVNSKTFSMTMKVAKTDEINMKKYFSLRFFLFMIFFAFCFSFHLFNVKYSL